MKRAAIVVLACLAIALPLRADFDAIVRAIESGSGLRRVNVPFLGFARFLVWVAQPKGVHDFQLATWEGETSLDRREIGSIVRNRVGKGFSPIVETVSRRSGEWAFIYAKPHGASAVEMILVTHDSSDTVVLRAVIDAETFAQDFQHPTSLKRVAAE
jgi:hypothetical protein